MSESKSITCPVQEVTKTIQQQAEEGWDLLAIVPWRGSLHQVNVFDLLLGKKDAWWEWTVTQYRLFFQRRQGEV
jgi:hypothetical protein